MRVEQSGKAIGALNSLCGINRSPEDVKKHNGRVSAVLWIWTTDSDLKRILTSVELDYLGRSFGPNLLCQV